MDVEAVNRSDDSSSSEYDDSSVDISNHPTISQDHTAAGGGANDPLEALRKEDRRIRLPKEFVQRMNEREHQMIHSSRSAFLQANRRPGSQPTTYLNGNTAEPAIMFRQKLVPPLTSGDRIEDIPDARNPKNTNETYSPVRPQQQDIITREETDQAILDDFNELQAENSRLRAQLQKTCLPVFQVFHHIEDGTGQKDRKEKEDSSNKEGPKNTLTLYLGNPYWVATATGVELAAESPIPDIKTYIQYHESLQFLVYRYYSNVANKPTLSEVTNLDREDPKVRPVHHKELIIFNSPNMKRIIEKLLLQDSMCRNRSALEKGMSAPYLWWYHTCRKRSIVEEWASQEPALMQLSRYIEESHGTFYESLECLLSRGYVTAAWIEFLCRPGDVILFEDDSAQPRAAMAIGWLRKTPEIRPAQQNTSGEISLGSLSHEPLSSICQIDVICHKYNGNIRPERRILNMTVNESKDDELKIISLKFKPLKYCTDEIKTALRERATKFLSLRAGKMVSYNDSTESKSQLGQRYIIDYDTYRKLHFGDHRHNEERRPDIQVGSESHAYLYPPTVIGFNLRLKKWEDLKIDCVSEVIWNKKAFDSLVADEETKELIQALVTSQVASERGTDIIENKGNGLIMLLHGSPGTGKTFTAESVAEIAEKPLYPVTCGDIGTKPEEVEKYLKSVFFLGKQWGCVVLLDEAEVFLEQRSLSDLARNALVSVFLRALEYYDGILILTSNRVGSFDEAFKSRIQLALHYEKLTQPQRAQIWRNFFNRLQNLGEDNIDYDDVQCYISDLSKVEMNGRQIRNCITTARQLAQFRGRKMTVAHLNHAIKVTSKFDTYLKDVHQGYSDEDVARGDGVR